MWTLLLWLKLFTAFRKILKIKAALSFVIFFVKTVNDVSIAIKTQVSQTRKRKYAVGNPYPSRNSNASKNSSWWLLPMKHESFKFLPKNISNISRPMSTRGNEILTKRQACCRRVSHWRRTACINLHVIVRKCLPHVEEKRFPGHFTSKLVLLPQSVECYIGLFLLSKLQCVSKKEPCTISRNCFWAESPVSTELLE